MRIEGTAAVVTGAGSGMGAATAKYLAQRGAKVALLDVKAQSVADIAKACGGLALDCDVTDEAAMAGALDRAADKHGTARILVNCAGVADSGSTVKRSGEMKTLAQFRRVLDVNLTGTWNAMRLAAARLRTAEPFEDGERGVFVNTASVAGLDYAGRRALCRGQGRRGGADRGAGAGVLRARHPRHGDRAGTDRHADAGQPR